MHFIILLIVSLTAAASGEIDFDKCKKALISQKHCCKKLFVSEGTVDDDVKECKLMPNIAGSCEKSLCFGTKLGIATADGTIKMDNLKKHVAEKLADHKDILEAVNEKCFDDKYKSFGEPDECDLDKMRHCIAWQYVFRCPDFSDDEKCKDLKEMAAECQKLDV